MANNQGEPSPLAGCKVFFWGKIEERAIPVPQAIAIVRQVLADDEADSVDLVHIGIYGTRESSQQREESFDFAALLEELFGLLGERLTQITLNNIHNQADPIFMQLFAFVVGTCLPKCPKIQAISIKYAILDGQAGSTLADFYRRTQGMLQSFTLIRCPVTFEFLQRLKEGVTTVPKNQRLLSSLQFENLNLLYQSEGSVAFMTILELITLFPDLKNLKIRKPQNVKLTDHHITTFANVFEKVPMLTQLHIFDMFSNVGHKAVDLVFGGMSNLRALEGLYLNYIPVATFPSLSQTLRICQQIKTLNLETRQFLEGPAQDEFTKAVATLPALKTVCICPGTVNKPTLFLSSLLEHLVASKSPLTSLSVSFSNDSFEIDDCWVKWIPHLGPPLSDFRIFFRLSYTSGAHNDNKLPDVVSAMKKNAYISSFSILLDDFEPQIPAICKRNKLLAKVKECGCLPACSMVQQQWALLLEGVANHTHAFDPTALFMFVRYNVSNIFVSHGTTRKRIAINQIKS